MGPENFTRIRPTGQKLRHFFEVTHRRTDGRTDGRTNKNISPQYHNRIIFFAYMWGGRRETLRTLQNFYFFTSWRIIFVVNVIYLLHFDFPFSFIFVKLITWKNLKYKMFCSKYLKSGHIFIRLKNLFKMNLIKKQVFLPRHQAKSEIDGNF